METRLQVGQVTWHQEPLPSVTGDSRSLRTIFYELLDNALKFSRGRESIHIAIVTRTTDTEHHIGMQDNGIGFNMRHKETIFGIFHRLNSEKDYHGLGLGLPLVRRAVLRHGGRVWCESREGQGSTFWVAFPKKPSKNL